MTLAPTAPHGPWTPPGSGDSDAPRVLLVEDDTAVAASLRLVLDHSGMITDWAGTGAAAKALVTTFNPNIVLVDLELPDTNGIALIRWFMDNHRCGIIVVTGNPEPTERIVGLELGADDYINKPPSTRELVARIRAVHRRIAGQHAHGPADGAEDANATKEPPGELVLGGITLDLARHLAVNAAGRPIDITAAEFAVLAVLAAPLGETVSRDRLSEAALRRPWRPEDRSIDQLIFLLRTKLFPDGTGQHIIQSVRGVGYRLVLPPRS